MKIIKTIIEYITIFIITVAILVILLTSVAKIPRKYIEENMEKAVSYFKDNWDEITKVKRYRKYTYLHKYGDALIFNIIYCINTDKPFEAILKNEYYNEEINEYSSEKYIKVVTQNLEPNEQHIRYWDGSILIIKPLLIFFTIEQIYILNVIVLSILISVLLIILMKKKYFAITISFIVGLISIAIWYVPFVMEYVWAFYIMIITSIIAVIIEDKNIKSRKEKDEKLYKLFLLTGILMCFFDLLTTEIVTILVPLVIVLSMRIKNKEEFISKNELKFLIKSLTLWGISYVGMWISKWGLAALFLNINIKEVIIEQAIYRINGQVGDYGTLETMFISIKKNFLTLYPINLVKNGGWIISLGAIILGIGWILIIDRKNKTKMKYMLLMILIGIIPYIRYIILSNHSLKHSFFTFRSQISTIMCIMLILIYCTDKKKLFSDLKISKKK